MNKYGRYSFYSKFIKNFGIVAAYSYLSKFIAFIAVIFITRLLNPEDFGIVAMIAVFTGFINVFAEGGISYAVIRSDYGSIFQRSLTSLVLLMGITLCLITLLLAPVISIFYSNDELLLPAALISTLFITRSLSIVQTAVLNKELKFKELGKQILFQTTSQSIITIGLASLGFKYWSIIWGQLVSSLIFYVTIGQKTFFIKKIYPAKYVYASYLISKSIIINIISFRAINYWSRNVDNLVIGKFYSATNLGIYDRSFKLFMLPMTMISGVITQVLLPSLKELKGKSDKNVMEEYSNIIKLIGIVIFPISIVFILFPEEFIILLWGEKWIQVSVILPYFGILIMSQSLFTTIGQILVLEGKERTLRNAGFFSAIFMISGILIGALISFESIPKFYTYSFILFIIPYNVYYIFYKALGMPYLKLSLFWVPRFIAYFIILFYLKTNLLFVQISLFFLFIMTVYDFFELIYKYRQIRLLK